ncbi:hypothetical protein BY996DRAFT_6556398 [Phakopsora pachyrhizi]|nr:hypothetical protein BY996DRAFT_6556398 [Phakopsora pachyrhizi]
MVEDKEEKLDGFIKKSCYSHPSDIDCESLCIFMNPIFNNGSGLKPITTFMADYTQIDLDMCVKVGKGAITDRKLHPSDLVIKDHATIFISVETRFSTSDFIQNFVDLNTPQEPFPNTNGDKRFGEGGGFFDSNQSPEIGGGDFGMADNDDGNEEGADLVESFDPNNLPTENDLLMALVDDSCKNGEQTNGTFGNDYTGMFNYFDKSLKKTSVASSSTSSDTDSRRLAKKQRRLSDMIDSALPLRMRTMMLTGKVKWGARGPQWLRMPRVD